MEMNTVKIKTILAYLYLVAVVVIAIVLLAKSQG